MLPLSSHLSSDFLSPRTGVVGARWVEVGPLLQVMDGILVMGLSLRSAPSSISLPPGDPPFHHFLIWHESSLKALHWGDAGCAGEGKGRPGTGQEAPVPAGRNPSVWKSGGDSLINWCLARAPLRWGELSRVFVTGASNGAVCQQFSHRKQHLGLLMRRGLSGRPITQTNHSGGPEDGRGGERKGGLADPPQLPGERRGWRA